MNASQTCFDKNVHKYKLAKRGTTNFNSQSVLILNFLFVILSFDLASSCWVWGLLRIRSKDAVIHHKPVQSLNLDNWTIGIVRLLWKCSEGGYRPRKTSKCTLWFALKIAWKLFSTRTRENAPSKSFQHQHQHNPHQPGEDEEGR